MNKQIECKEIIIMQKNVLKMVGGHIWSADSGLVLQNNLTWSDLVPVQPDPQVGLHQVPFTFRTAQVPQTFPGTLTNYQTGPALLTPAQWNAHRQQQAFLVLFLP
jgi:hypothetical protein